MRNIRILLGAAALLGAIPALAQQRGPAERVHAASKGKAALEMVFVLDTTGSMGGLIDGAKQRIWSIVNDVIQTSARPKVRVGLVAYRDRGDAYVTQVLPLTADLDKVYTTLMDYRAEGGGDEPENVRRALADGVQKAGWSPREPGIAQILFLVGDAPPHEDYQDEPDVLKTTAEAIRRGIIVNTIQCGSGASTRAVWEQIARHGEGQYFAIEQDGGVQVTTTPYDKRLAELGEKIGRTYMAYGGGGGLGGARYRRAAEKRQAAAEGKIATSAPASAAADRALNKAINTLAYEGDLLQSLENGSVTLEKIKTEDLPNALQKMTPEQRKREIERRLVERKRIRAEILSLSRQRDAFVAAERKKRAGAKSASFDAAVAGALKKQMARRGIR